MDDDRKTRRVLEGNPCPDCGFDHGMDKHQVLKEMVYATQAHPVPQPVPTVPTMQDITSPAMNELDDATDQDL